jgi:hypothetical protein
MFLSIAMLGVASIGKPIPESAMPVLFSAYGIPLLAPLAHMAAVKERFFPGAGKAN